jgi:hypothetical protein
MARRIPGIRVWQTYAWSRGKRSSHANIWQYKNGVTVANHTVDLNESFGGEGWWNTLKKEQKEAKPKMDPKDAEKIIRFLSAAWHATEDKEAREELHRLANEVRKAAGMPPA